MKEDKLSYQVVCMGGWLHTNFWSVNLKERDNTEVEGIDGKILLKFTLNRMRRRSGQWALMRTVINLIS